MHYFVGQNVIAVAPEWIRASGILGAFVLLALIVRFAWKALIGRWIKRTETTLDDAILTPLRGLAFWALILSGAYFAAQEIYRARQETVIWPLLGQAFTIGWILLAVGTAVRILNAYAKWKIEQAADKGDEAVRDVATRVSFGRKIVTALVVFLGGLYILSVIGVDTSPIVAGGALGGVVIGIALQDTLANVFAGFFLNIDRPVKIGDLIRLETSEEGFVEEVGWRYTKVRLWSNNLLIIPNNKLSQSIITNFNLPAEPLSIYVYCGVAYDSDLDHVERVAIRVAKQVQDSEPGGDTSWEPVVRFKEFGDSSITFVTVLRSAEVGAQHRVHHQFVKALHRAFKDEGIEIPFPIRTLIHKNPQPKS